jgi:hypothetical protein
MFYFLLARFSPPMMTFPNPSSGKDPATKTYNPCWSIPIRLEYKPAAAEQAAGSLHLCVMLPTSLNQPPGVIEPTAMNEKISTSCMK